MAQGTNVNPFDDSGIFNNINQSTSNRKEPINRALQRSKIGAAYKPETISILDIDTAILSYLEKINLTVEVDGQKKPVPIIYGDPERWKQSEKNGYIKDKDGQVQIPLMMFRRVNIARRDDITRRLNQEERVTYTTGYSYKNRYDRFSQQVGLEPTQELYKVRLGDFVQMDYEFLIWTDYVTHTNQIIEQLNWNSDEYWGMDNGPRFKSTIDIFNTNLEITDTEERIVRTNFNLLVKGHILPDNVDDIEGDEAVIRSYTTQKTVFFTETTGDATMLRDERQLDELINRQTGYNKSNRIGALFDREIFTSNNTSQLKDDEFEEVLAYVGYNEIRNATFGDEQTFVFNGQRKKQVPDVDYLEFSDGDLFQIFINGVFIPPSTWSYVETPNSLIFTFNTTLLGYTLSETDTVKGIGKFETIE